MPQKNPYLSQVDRVMPRLLALFDSALISPTCGYGDRYHWAWKLIDFANGTFQGAAHGLARLIVSGQLPLGLAEHSILRRIEAMVLAADTMRRADGSMEEAFPHESSFCVTALVAFDILSAIQLLGDRLSPVQRVRFLDIVEPMVGFLHRTEEVHGFISNHLATASAALYKWSLVSGRDGVERAQQILDRILAAQSEEGWFVEYEGADPAYQSLCLYYLADIHHFRPDVELWAPLRRSVTFLSQFAHPDGSFGGAYGSRNARFFVPAGVEALSATIPEARSLAVFMRQSIAARRTVTLEAMDAPNLVPMFNAYCWAAALWTSTEGQDPEVPTLPCFDPTPWRRHLPRAGLVIDNGPAHYTVISTHKGGVCYHFEKRTGSSIIDVGVAARDYSGRLYTTQSWVEQNPVVLEGDTLVVEASFTAARTKRPGPLQFILLRLLALSVLRVPRFSGWMKRFLVHLLIIRKSSTRCTNRRTILLGSQFSVQDEQLVNQEHLVTIKQPGVFYAIHMASHGYWQMQDDRP